ncbi:hypothetical protein N9K66_00885 [Planktomarina temperata]|nr:hypothetical protein [Planktomarina temperata]
MLIFSRYNLVLLAVPKTGSTALEVALGQEADGRFGNPPEMKHLPLYRYNRFVRPLLQLTTGQDPETCQTRFLSPGGSGGPITHLFQYEQMDLACKFLENRLELELDLPWLNQAAIGPAPLDPDLEAQYRKIYAGEFQLWQDASI